jgi:pyruvate,orthophosphate dikinase
VIATGLPASPGAASGAVVFSADEAVERVRDGAKVVLVRLETSPEDIHGMEIAEGILTARGGMTSHAAVVARGMGKPCVAGCGALDVDYEAGEFRVGGHVVRRGDAITLDGATGRVMVGKVPMIKPSLTGDFGIILRWADGLSRMHVRTNADTPRDAKVAIDFGAKGIGLCRTEHMFFEGERIDAMREMILAQDLDGRQKALAKLLPMQRDDFIGIFKAMRGFPVIIRTLDPPLHEFLPHTQADIADLAAKLGVTEQELESKVRSLHEANPMLGHRGCRLGISYPEITAMQARAVFEAACEVRKQGYKVFPEVMIPLVGDVEELRNQRQIVEQVAREVMAERKTKIRYLVGTMIEIPRAALTADQIAREADFFSYGTNDLTQTTFGLSRDDAGKFLPGYVSQGLLPADPFQKLDPTGVGQLVDLGIRKGRSTKKDLEIGICGEHGGEPSSIEFCHRVGMDYVSCSPYRVPIARLACAHAALRGKIKVVVRGEA